jgi:hypothetical protein
VGDGFAGYDFYLVDWTVDERLGTMPPAGGVLGDYIFSRLLDSLDLNAGKFVDWFMNLHLMPIISDVANVALGAAVGSLAGPLGVAFGALLGAHVNVFKLGGPKLILDRTKNECEWIKRRLNEQAAWPIGFLYGDSTTPFDDHQVLALEYDDHGDGTATLTEWDNREGNLTRKLELDFRGAELQVGNELPVGDPPAPQRPRPLKGIVLDEYSSRQPPANLHLS